MTTKKYQLENYRKFLLNRTSASPDIQKYMEHCLATEDEAARFSFHKLMVHNWPGSDTQLFDTLSEHFQSPFIPVNYVLQGSIATFYTSSLSLVLKIMNLEFLFPHQKNMYNIDILFNDKASADLFENRISLEDIVTGVVSGRVDGENTLNLSNFCNDPEFIEKKIHFYKLALLSHFKILMLRMGRETKLLNLSNNNLSHVPVEILNFFITGELIGIDLSNNNIPLLSDLHRITTKLEKLWIEGNPLCADIDTMSYVKHIVMKFPKLIELDGIRLNEHGIILPFFRNFLITPVERTKALVENFMVLYFSNYDCERRMLDKFYDFNVRLTIATSFSAEEDEKMPIYAFHTRNLLNPAKDRKKRVYITRHIVSQVLRSLPRSTHDPGTFTVDVLKHDNNIMILVIDGIYKEKPDVNTPERFFQFRRTFIFRIQTLYDQTQECFITNEMFQISFATQEQIKNSFKNPNVGTNPLALRNPSPEEIGVLSNIFSHLSHLKQPEAILRLKNHNWDLRSAIKQFVKDLKMNRIPGDKFMQDNDIPASSLHVEEMG